MLVTGLLHREAMFVFCAFNNVSLSLKNRSDCAHVTYPVPENQMCFGVLGLGLGCQQAQYQDPSSHHHLCYTHLCCFYCEVSKCVPWKARRFPIICTKFFEFFTGIWLLTFFVNLIFRQKRGMLLLIGFWLFCFNLFPVLLLGRFEFIYVLKMMFRKCIDKSSVWRLWPNKPVLQMFLFHWKANNNKWSASYPRWKTYSSIASFHGKANHFSTSQSPDLQYVSCIRLSCETNTWIDISASVCPLSSVKV